MLLLSSSAWGDPPSAAGPEEEERTSVHAQGTVISEEHGSFRAPYSGLNSLQRDEPRRTSVTGFGVRIEQQLTGTLGFFGHAGWNDGRTGDGRLRYGYEEIAEAYYLIKLVDHLSITADFQFVEHPATGLRVHLEF